MFRLLIQSPESTKLSQESESSCSKLRGRVSLEFPVDATEAMNLMPIPCATLISWFPLQKLRLYVIPQHFHFCRRERSNTKKMFINILSSAIFTTSDLKEKFMNAEQRQIFFLAPTSEDYVCIHGESGKSIMQSNMCNEEGIEACSRSFASVAYSLCFSGNYIRMQ